MRRKRRRKAKTRFYVIVGVLAVVICISMVKLIQGISSDSVGFPVMKQADAAMNIEDDKMVICLDPGHGGHDDGSTSILGFAEKDINLKVALNVGKLLENSDIEIVYTRTTDEANGSNQEEDLKTRCKISNDANADIYVSIHCNFDENSPKSKGMEVWCRFPKQKGEELAICLDNQLGKAGYTRDRGIKYESEGSLYVLRNTRAAASLVELGFLSNMEDSEFLKSDEGQDKCSKAIVQGIKDYFGIK
jgi:N-acetylmuramoyl-L-alanine amidase